MSARNRDSLRLLALACFAVTFGLAAVSHVRGTLFGRIGPAHSLYVRSEYGKCVLHVHRTDWCVGRCWLAANWPHAAGLSPAVRGWWRFGGFSYATGGTTGGISVRQVAIPYWPLAAGCLLLWAGCRLKFPRRKDRESINDRDSAASKS